MPKISIAWLVYCCGYFAVVVFVCLCVEETNQTNKSLQFSLHHLLIITKLILSNKLYLSSLLCLNIQIYQPYNQNIPFSFSLTLYLLLSLSLYLSIYLSIYLSVTSTSNMSTIMPNNYFNAVKHIIQIKSGRWLKTRRPEVLLPLQYCK